MRNLPTITSLLFAGFIYAAETNKPIRFNRDIRPIMSDTCFHCHGFDPKSRKGGLRLDIRDEALKAGKSGEIAIVPGVPDKSEIIRRIFSPDAEDVMPGKESHKTLTPEQKELFRQWVAQGAVYEPHWAYKPLSKPAIPPTPAGGHNEIDAFIGAKLADKNILPSSEASREKLLRRLSFDLTGLPPTPAEIAAFVADTSPQAYEKQVERLLSSPHYGERMAVWWLDIARFADTVGYHGDQNQRIFPYRDYVIEAFNQNKPFDVFTREQIAGDLLPNPTDTQLIASGYNRLNMMTREGGAQAKEYLAKYGAERVRSVSNAWLGSTFGCAECHDHKFDPISQKDFYSLQAFFADVKQWGVYADYSYTPEPELKGVNNDYPFYPEVRVKNAYLAKQDARLRSEMQTLYAQSAMSMGEKFTSSVTPTFLSFQHILTQYPNGLIRPAGTSVFTSAPPAKSTKVTPKKTVAAKPDSKAKPLDELIPFTPDSLIKIPKNIGKGERFTVRLDAPSIPASSKGVHWTGGPIPIASVRLDIPKDALSPATIVNLSIRFAIADNKGKERNVGIYLADASHREPRYKSGVEMTDINDGWTLKMPDSDVHAVWILDTPVTLKPDEKFVVHFDTGTALTFKISLSPLGHHDPLLATAPATLARLVQARVDTFKELMPTYLSSTNEDRNTLLKIRALNADLRRQNQGYAWTMVTQATKALEVRVLPRGNFLDQSGPIVLPATPSFLPRMRTSTPERRLTRLDLAEWLTSSDNPITARTFINRLWQIFYGTGLSGILDDLGSQGEPPSHPELLEWLAIEFRDKGWDVKNMVRLIVTSRTYRQNSSLRPELKEMDPANRWLASQNPRRLDAEFIRDNALAIAGLLHKQDIGGPSAKPYQPEGYYEPIQFPNRTYIASVGAEQWRRGLYMHWQRMFLHPMLINFDAPARDECTALRNYSNTPQQALTLLNDPTFVEAARAFASRLLALPPKSDRLEMAFQYALGRKIKPAERSSLEKLIQSQNQYYQSHPEEAAKLIKVGFSTAPVNTDSNELAAWTQACRVILNSHEIITRY